MVVAARVFPVFLCWLLLAGSRIAPTATGGDIFADPSPDHLPALIHSFTDPNLRFGASRAIATIGKPAVAPLNEALRVDEVDIRIWSAYTLGQIGPDASPAAPGLAEALGDTDKDVRAVAARSLGQIRAGDAVVIDALKKSTSDVHARVRQWSVVSLGQIGAASKAAVPQLIDALDDQSVRADATRSLVQIGTDAIPLLTAALENDNVRLEAAQALRKIDPAAAKRLGIEKPTSNDLKALEISLLNVDKDVAARTNAAMWLGSLGLEAAPILITAFADEEDDVVQASIVSFAKIGPSAVPRLQETLQHESAQVRAAAVDALAAIGPSAKDATADLITVLKDVDRSVRHRAVSAIDVLGAGSEPSIAALITVMQDPGQLEPTRQLAIKVLVRIAPSKHEQTIAALRQSTDDQNYGVSSLAKEMLKLFAADNQESTP